MIYDQVRQQLLPILSGDKSVGVFASGGFDSTTLLYFCLLLIQEQALEKKLRIFMVPRRDDCITHNTMVMEWMNQKFNSDLSITLVGNPDLHHSQQVLSGLKEAQHACDYLLFGDNANPPHLPGGPDNPRSPVEQFVQPFFDFTKKDIVELAYYIGFGEVANMTQTCATSTKIRCRACWQCQERAWAFAANGITDTGTM